jgi:cytochrome P450
MLRPNFVREQISDLGMEERHVQSLIKCIHVKEDGWTDFTNLQALFFRLTLDTATEFLFGKSVDSQLASVSTPESNSAAQAEEERLFSINIDQALTHISTKFRFGKLHWMYRPAGLEDNKRIIGNFVKRYVDHALHKCETKADTNSNGGEKKRYVFLDALAEQTQDPVELQAHVLNTLAAGRDTTASLISWVFHELVRNPKVFDQLRASILDTFGSYDNPQSITFASLKDCRYLQHCLNETLRLWPTVPFNGRRTNKSTTLPTGGGSDGKSPIFLASGSVVEYSVHVMHRRKDLWGEDADVFRPERFESRKPGWEFLPFNGGPRICIGQQFALTEASYVLVRLLQRFDKIEAVPAELSFPTTSELTITSSPGRPVTLRMRQARE